MSKTLFYSCPSCGQNIKIFKNPVPAVDIIIEVSGNGKTDGIVLIERKNEPFGWAIPGGFVDYGESVEDAAIREAKEETNLDITLIRLLGVYSNPNRDNRKHTISTVFIAKSAGIPVAGDDAKKLSVFKRSDLPLNLAFDHEKILQDYYESTSSNR